MQRAFYKLLVLVLLMGIGSFLGVNLVDAASSDDAVGNYVRRDSEDYNFLPLVLDPDSSTGGTGELKDVISYNMAYDQGYEVQCAKPAWSISPQVYGAIEEYFELYSDPVTLSSNASYTVDFSGGTIPLFRGDEALEDTQKNSSFEGYFGANYLKDAPPELNSSGVANLLLNQDGQCAAKFLNLHNIFGIGGLCSKLENSDQCALNRSIPNTGFTTQGLYNELGSIFSRSSGERNLSCNDLMSGWNTELGDEFGISEQTWQSDIQPAARAVKVMPLNLDILYRLAFLVISPQQSTATDGDVFDFLQTRSPLPNQVNHDPINEDKHAPIVIGFKVPMLATNSLFSLPGLRDSALLSAYSMRNLEQLEREQGEIIGERSEFIEKIIENQETKPVVNCDGMPQCAGGGDSQALFQALIDMINGSEQTCVGFKGPYENAGDLGSPAEVSEEKKYKDPYFSEVIPISNTAGFDWHLEVRDENVQSQAASERVPVVAHLITPYGSNLEYIAETLQSFFNVEQFIKMVENNCIPDFNGECGMIPEYFTFGGILADLDSGSDSFSFIYDNDPECLELEDPEEIANCQKKSFGATTTEQPREPLRILGARVGWMIRKIQENIRGFGSKAYEYITQCERTEDLFLGRCLGYQGQPGGSDSSAANSCNDYQGVTVDLPTMDGLEKLVCNVAHGDSRDAQMLWGMMQVDGSPFLREIRGGATSMSCGDLIINECGASQIVGILVPACIDTDACSQATAIAESEELQQAVTTDVACSIEGSLEYILKTRKGEITWLREQYRAANGSDPSTEQLYYMMAARNYGLPVETFVKPACEGAPPVQGCGGANYCECVMDTFKFSCL